MAEFMVDEQVIATEVSFEEYLDKYAADFCEWVDGKVIKLSPVTERHDDLTQFLMMWINAYLAYRPIAKLRQSAFVMKISETSPAREPDLQVILQENFERLTPTRMNGAADLVIEVVSAESTARDYGTKFKEYEAGGVREYWIIDPLRYVANFHVLNTEGFYAPHTLNAAGEFESVVLPGLRLPVDLLWADELPDILNVVTRVTEMLKD